MLSFMREQESRTAAEPSRDAGPPDSGASNIPETQEYLTVTANRQSVRRSTILVAVLVGIGLVCLLLMIRKSQPQGAAAAQGKNDQSRIEAAINRLTGVRSEMSGHMDEIVKKFYEFSDVVQVRVGELVKNPFDEENAAPDLRPVVVVDGSQAEMVRWQQLEQQARRLKLLSIMRSEQGDCCMINDQILREGDMIGPFTIARIGSNVVELAWPASGASDVGTSNTGEMKTLLKLSE